MSGSGQKCLFLKISLVPFRPLRSRGGTRRPNSASEKGGPGAAFPSSLVALFNDRPFARLNHICSVVALDVAIVTQPRGFPIDRLGKERISTDSGKRSPTRTRVLAVLPPVVRCSTREGRACLRMISRSLSEKVILCEDGAGAGAAAVDRPVRGSTSTILWVEGSTITMSSRTTKKLYPRYWGRISTTSAGRGWKRTSLGTTVPTDNEKLTLLMGATFSLAID